MVDFWTMSKLLGQWGQSAHLLGNYGFSPKFKYLKLVVKHEKAQFKLDRVQKYFNFDRTLFWVQVRYLFEQNPKLSVLQIPFAETHSKLYKAKNGIPGV